MKKIIAIAALLLTFATPVFADTTAPVVPTPAPTTCALSVADLDKKIADDPEDFASYRDLGQYVLHTANKDYNVEVFYEGKGVNGVDTYLVVALTNATDKCVEVDLSPIQLTDNDLAKAGIKIVNDVK